MIERAKIEREEELTLRLSLSVSPTRVHRATSRSPARGAIGSKMIPSLSRMSKRGLVRALIAGTETPKERKSRRRFHFDLPRLTKTEEKQGNSPCFHVCVFRCCCCWFDVEKNLTGALDIHHDAFFLLFCSSPFSLDVTLSLVPWTQA